MATKSEPRFGGHAHRPAEGEPAAWNGDQVCADCRKLGHAGDAQHPHGALPWGQVPPQQLPPVPPEVLRYEARRLGEGDRDE